MATRPLLRRLNRLWRWFGTVFSFAVFGLGSLLMGLFIAPVYWLLFRKRSDYRRRVRRLVAGALRFFIRLMRFFGVLHYRIEGLRSEEGRPALILANHPSLIDVVFLLALFPEAQCVVKRALWLNPVTRLIVSACDYIPNDDPELFLNASVASLQEGQSLILFPEGTRTGVDGMFSFKPGAAAIAMRSGAHIQPVLLSVTPPTLSKADLWYSVPADKVHMDICILPVWKPSVQREEAGGHPGRRHDARRLNSDMESWFRNRVAAWKPHSTA